ncbi:TetR/AcrR family transcriptional regulator [Methylophilus sp. TWE2]|uniref:TetR/AcrR family transcriptional regulator n=1 Tax=Methylophilus sp. TWE2 TaxID=1662285 RepID=UPI0006713943|nr:TetR/AcrR family transcriptional regulator [Methylophilus sp. TWE2]AKR43792.1 TetR family transcriptional regulator [Methylophilus sp. TWE2]
MTTETKKARGRPRVFDPDEALDKALQIFWNRGYEGTSLAELTETLGVNKPSLYAAFGNKEELFMKALSKYTTGPVAFVRDVVNEPTARAVAQRFLYEAAEFLTQPSHPKGCMVVQGALSGGESAEMVKKVLIQYRAAYEKLLTKRFEQAKSDGDLPSDASPQALAKYLATLHQGMSVQATSGASKEELLSIADLALDAWPKA